MQIINEARKDINKIWGRQSVKDTQYRPLKYLLEVPVDEGLLVHNVVSGELVLLEGDEIAQYKAGQHADLIAKHFLVPQDFDEHASVLNLRKILRLLDNDKSITGYTILPTTYCNARCFYCYQADFEHIHMTDEIADQTVEFIEKNHGNHPVSIGWYGGEPLVGKDTINRICSNLKEKGIEFVSSMISNGYLFDEKLVKTAKDEWNLNNIQITLDGTEEVYNKVKDFQGIQGSPFYRVIRNIDYLLENDVHVDVRMNLDNHNSDNLYELITELKKQFGQNRLFNAYVHVVFKDETGETVLAREERDELLSREVELNNVLVEHSLQRRRIKLPSLDCYACMADSDKSIIIYPDGVIAKCLHMPKEDFGNIFDYKIDAKKWQSWQEYAEFEECASCRLFPQCIKSKKCNSASKCNIILRRNEEYENIRLVELVFRNIVSQCVD